MTGRHPGDVDLFVRFRRNVVGTNDSRTGQRTPSDLTNAFAHTFAVDRQVIANDGRDYYEEDTAGHGVKGRRAIRMVIGGYDVDEVNNLLSRAERAVARGGEIQRAFARQELRTVELNRRVLGYARESVHCLVAELGRQLGTG
jgi:hypothetical protein